MSSPAALVRCAACYEPVREYQQSACPHCRASYHAACLALEACVVAGCPPPPPPAPVETYWRWRLLELMIVVMIIGVLAAIAVPNFGAGSRPRAMTRACYANQKTLVGAMEMYNLDKGTKRTELNARFFQELHSSGYLQTIPQDPGFGKGSSGNYQSTDSGNGMRCFNHGSIQ